VAPGVSQAPTVEHGRAADRPAEPGGRLRVEALAARADTSVDTIRFYQKRKLLPPPQREGRIAWYGAEHVERLAHIRALQARGLTLALIGRIVRGELDDTDAPLAAAVATAADDADGPERFLTIDELAHLTGVPRALLETVAAEGLLLPRTHGGEDRYTAADVDVVRAGMALLEQGLPLDELLALARVHHDETRAVAERAVEMFDAHVRQPLRVADIAADERAGRLVDAFRALLPAITALVTHHFRRVLLEVAQEHLERVGDPAELDAATVASARRIEHGWPS
jgi:DNA-binding transcriptional MerR regulator